MPQALVALVVLGAFLLYRFLKKLNESVNAAWATVARDLGGTFDPKAGPWYRRSRLIVADVEGVPLRIDHYTVSRGKSSTTYTRFGAPTSGSGKLSLKVYGKHFFSGLGRALGFQDVTTGDADFDEDFVVKTNDEDLARAWLSDDVRAAIRRADGYMFTLEEGRLTATKAVVEKSAEALETVAVATVAVAGRGERIRARWQRFAKERGSKATRHAGGRLHIQVEDSSVPLRIQTHGIDAGESTSTSVEGRVVGGKGEPFDLLDDEQALEALPSTIKKKLMRLEPTTVTSDGERVTVVLPGLITEERQLDEACELTRELAQAQATSYRR